MRMLINLLIRKMIIMLMSIAGNELDIILISKVLPKVHNVPISLALLSIQITRHISTLIRIPILLQIIYWEFPFVLKEKYLPLPSKNNLKKHKGGKNPLI